MKVLPENIRQEMLARIKGEIETAMIDDHIIVDDWFPYDADWEINIWTSEGLTKAVAYEIVKSDAFFPEDEVTNTREWLDLYEARLLWPTRLANGVRISRDEEGALCIWAECADKNSTLHWVDVTWLDLSNRELLGEEIP